MEMNIKGSTGVNNINGPTHDYVIEDGRKEDNYSMDFQSKDSIISRSTQERLSTKDEKNKHDPHGDVGVEHPTTYLETLMHVFKGNVGSGMFAMGDAYKNSGMAIAPWLIILLGIITVHCEHILITASHKVKHKLNLTTTPDFAETAKLCFATGPVRYQKYAVVMRKLVNVFLCITQFGFCCVYFVFISRNIKQVADTHGFEIDIHYHMAIILLPILLSCMIRNLKYLAPLSTLANIFMLLGICIILYYSTQDLPPLSSTKPFATIGQLPLFFGTALFAFEGIGLVLPIQAEMKKPKSFSTPLGVLNIGMTIVTSLYVIVGFLSYWKYGEAITGSVTLNLKEDDILAQCVKIIISLGILFTFALQFYIPIAIMWPAVSKKYGPFKNPVLLESAFRVFFVFVTFLLAESIPYLDLFISLVGALSSTTLALIVPPILEFATHWGVSEITPWMVLKNSFILLLGVLGCVTGTYESIRQIINAFINGST